VFVAPPAWIISFIATSKARNRKGASLRLS
jgi:hypothetical protein